MVKLAALFVIAFLVICVARVVTISAASENENSWASKKSMPESINGVKVAVVNGKIYAIGDSANFEYDPETDLWISRKPMPTARMFFEIAVCNNKIYTMGGRSSGLSFGSNEVYDPSTDTWEAKRSMPMNLSDMKADAVSGKIHVIGNNTHYIYDVAADSWTTGKSTNFYPHYGFSLAVVNGRIYLIGRNQTQIYDPQSDSWSQGASPPFAVLDAASGATTGIMAPKRIYVFGGWLSDIDGTSITQVYDPVTNNWTTGESMPTARGWLEVAVVKDKLYAIAGRNCAICPELDINEEYTPFGYGTPEPSYVPPSPSPTPSQESTTPEPFPTVLVIAASGASAVAVSAALIIYFKKRKQGKGS
jgi:hypothetical protein